MTLPDLAPKRAPAASSSVHIEVANALGRLRADRPKLATVCEPATMGKLVSMVLDAIDQECRWHYGLWTLEERECELKIFSVLTSDGVKIYTSSRTGSGGYQHEPIPWVERTRRKEQLLRIPRIMELVERVVEHAHALSRERQLEIADLVPNGFRTKSDCISISFFE